MNRACATLYYFLEFFSPVSRGHRPPGAIRDYLEEATRLIRGARTGLRPTRKPVRPVVWVWTAGLLRVSSRTDGSVNRSSLLLSTLSLLFSAAPSAFEIVCSSSNRHRRQPN